MRKSTPRRTILARWAPGTFVGGGRGRAGAEAVLLTVRLRPALAGLWERVTAILESTPCLLSVNHRLEGKCVEHRGLPLGNGRRNLAKRLVDGTPRAVLGEAGCCAGAMRRPRPGGDQQRGETEWKRGNKHTLPRFVSTVPWSFGSGLAEDDTLRMLVGRADR